jgi:tRNA-splicing ligase RtcB
MDLQDWIPEGAHRWRLPPRDGRSAAVLALASEPLLRGMDERLLEQACSVARWPGIVSPVCLMPDAHWGDGVPVGVVAAFDDRQGGVVSPAAVGVDGSCGVRCLLANLERAQVMERQMALADALTATLPAGLDTGGAEHLDADGLEAMLRGGALWAVEQGWGYPEDLLRCEEHGHRDGADAAAVSEQARRRHGDGLRPSGSGHHCVQVQWVAELLNPSVAAVMGLRQGAVAVMIHGGSCGLGHQVGIDYRHQMVEAAPEHGLPLGHREAACAPIRSPLGQRYLAAMQAAINVAVANRQLITHRVREVFSRLWPDAELRVLVDLSHNTCTLEDHLVGHDSRQLYVHRNGATRAYGPGHGTLPDPFGRTGQPVLVGGAMGACSYVLAGLDSSEALAFSSACRGPLEGAAGAGGDVDAVVMATEQAGLAQRVARLEPLISIP